MGNINIIKNKVGMGKLSVMDDSVSALLTQGEAIAAGLQLGEVYALGAAQDALENLKIAADSRLFRHIAQFFRMAPNATLYLKVMPVSLTYAELVEEAQLFAKQTEGKAKQMGIAYDGREAFDFKHIAEVVTVAQQVADALATEYIYCHITLSGNGFVYGAGLKNLPKLNSLNASSVSVSIAVDANWAKANPSHADLGLTLGAIAKSSVQQSIAHVGGMNLYGAGFTSAALVGGALINEVSLGDLSVLDQNGYVCLKTYAGKAGIYFNDAFTCTEVTDDFAQIYTNRTMNKAMRYVREALLPRVNGNLKVDAITGELNSMELTQIKEEVGKGLQMMQKAGEVSGFAVDIDPEQDVLTTGILDVAISVIPVGVTKTINVTIGYKTKLGK